MFNDIFEQVSNTSIDIREGLKNLLIRTWAATSIAHCRYVLESRSFGHTVHEADISRVELRADEVRCAVYSNMNMWSGTKERQLVECWFDMSISEQNQILIEAFPDGQVYGV